MVEAMIRADLHEANRRSWNAATRAHQTHKDGQAAFLRSGGTTLFPEEIDLVGEVRGQRLLHLCCNAGPDTLSWAARGATVTGVDISDTAIAEAELLSRESGLAGTFVRADVYDFLATASAAGQAWDVVFLSYGALCWLSDLGELMRGVARVLAPRGRLVFLEFHPFVWTFDDDLRHTQPYGEGGQLATSSGVGDYVGLSGDGLVPWGASPGVRDFQNPHPSHEFTWGVADLLDAVAGAGLVLETVREWPYANGCKLWDACVELPGRRYTLPDGVPRLPLMLGARARRPG